MGFTAIRKYNGDQVVLTSGRLIFNAREDNIFVTSKKDLAISAGGSVHINVGPSGGSSAQNMFILNAPRIQLGLGTAQPVPKGDEVVKVLNSICSALNQLATSLSTAVGVGVGTVSEPSINAAGTMLQGQITNVQSLIKQINSTVSFTV